MLIEELSGVQLVEVVGMIMKIVEVMVMEEVMEMK